MVTSIMTRLLLPVLSNLGPHTYTHIMNVVCIGGIMEKDYFSNVIISYGISEQVAHACIKIEAFKENKIDL